MVDKYLSLSFKDRTWLMRYYFYFLKEWKDLNEIGSLLKATRESSGISIDEVSDDLNIKDVIIENIEDGKIGAFKDIFVLKEYIESYAKYLGLDERHILNKFNEYLFEYTSKIPVKEIEKAVLEQAKEQKAENKVISPYTRKITKYNKYFYIIIYAVIFVLIILTVIWSVKQITSDSSNARIISCVD